MDIIYPVCEEEDFFVERSWLLRARTLLWGLWTEPAQFCFPFWSWMRGTTPFEGNATLLLW